MAHRTLSAQLRSSMGPLSLLTSSIGLKAIMAITGIILTGFLVVHAAGNLTMFSGREAFNAVPALYESFGPLLWVARLVLLGAVGLHIMSAAKLSTENIGARHQRYAVKHTAVTNYAARTMVVSGPIVLLFIIYHLLHLTLRMSPGAFSYEEGDLYSYMVQGFQVPWVAWFYAFANVLLGMHLFHGLWSMFQTLGINHPSYNFHLRALAITLTLFISGANVLMPLAVLSGAVVL